MADLFYYYGELKSARKIASVIVAHRTEKKFEMISDLVNVVEPLVGKDKQKKNLACLFQALRIEVNR